MTRLPRTLPKARVLSALLTAGVLSSATTGCVAPAFDAGAFQRNAIHALDSAVSDARTSALALEQHLAGQVMRPYADTVVSDSEDAIGPVEDSFDNVDPPTEADVRLRREVGGLLSGTGDALADARIALRSNDRAGMAKSMEGLRAIADQMEKASERLS